MKTGKREIVFSLQDFNGGSFPTNILERVEVDSNLTLLEAFEVVIEKMRKRLTHEIKP